ncbi:MAG TPA: hypothetical protein VFE23_11640 [Usitatibacter sp.]|jgi:hypothetical protein|nr:hypothetical protein [Usitatibacter sp.]
MHRLDVPSRRLPSLALAAVIGLMCARAGVAHADGSPPPATASDTLSHYEYFVLANCAPCVRELYFIGTLAVPTMNAPVFSGVARASAAASTTRPGELRFELLRAYPAGLESRQRFAMRVVLGVSAGSEGTLYPLGAGLLDEEEVPVLADALSRMGQSMSRAADDASMQVVDTEFHADSVRMGTVRTGNEVFAYVQVAQGDLPRFGLKQVWELPTMYLPAKDITALQKTVLQVNAKIRALRGR